MILTPRGRGLVQRAGSTELTAPARLRHSLLRKTHRHLSQTCQIQKLFRMTERSSVAMGQDVTAMKEALSKMYEDSKSGFPDVRKFR